MIKLNDNNIFVGHIKQLLKNFNLPNCAVGKENSFPHHHYIENHIIYSLAENGEAIRRTSYDWGKKYLNITSNFQVNNMVYDRDTHRYLGKYLRFLRDYKGIDLMCMYNCFDGELFTKELQFVPYAPHTQSNSPLDVNPAIVQEATSRTVIFKNDDNSVVYKVPVGKKTLSIKAFGGNNLDLCLYMDVTSDEEMVPEIAASTYVKIRGQKIFTYDVLKHLLHTYTDAKGNVVNEKMQAFIQKNLPNMFLLIKAPISATNSIVILEGTNFVDSIMELQGCYKSMQVKDDGSIPFSVFPQLFSHENAVKNYLLADKLVEYLTDNAIYPQSSMHDINKFHRVIINNKEKFNKKYFQGLIPGIWTADDTKQIEHIVIHNYSKIMNLYDVIGYLDKDIEFLLRRELDDAEL